jgi:hypothetical protein
VTEGGITGMAQAILGAPRSLAVASALLVRAVILGFGFTLGLAALAALSRTEANGQGHGQGWSERQGLLVTERRRCP